MFATKKDDIVSQKQAAGILISQKMRLVRYNNCLEQLYKIIKKHDADHHDPENRIVMPREDRLAMLEAEELLEINTK